MPLRLIVPVTLAFVGLTTALFLNQVVLTSPYFPEKIGDLIAVHEINLPSLPAPSINLGEKSGVFAPLIITPTPTETPTPTITPTRPPSSVPVEPPSSPAPTPVSPPQANPIFNLLDLDLSGLLGLFGQRAPGPSPGAPPSGPPASGTVTTPSGFPVLPEAVEISDSAINNIIGNFLPPNSGISDVNLAFEEGQVAVMGRISKPIEGDFRAQAGLKLENGLPVLKLSRASLGSFPIPVFFLSSLETMANEGLKNYLSSQNIFKVKTLEIKPGKIRLGLSLN